MPHDHHHHHHNHAADLGGDRRVAWAVGVNIALTLVQMVAGVISGSLALIADAVHNLSDALSLVIAFAARRIGRRPADAQMTFGYRRAEVVAALINYTTLIVIALYLVAEGVQRVLNPVGVDGWIVVVVAAVALVIDSLTAWLIYGMSKDSMNIRAAFLHNVADAMGSVAVIVAGTLILLYDWRLIDPLVTFLIAGYILWHASEGIRPTIHVLMLGSPDDPALGDLVAALDEIEGVRDVHAVHLWRMQEHETAFQAHVAMEDGIDGVALRARIKDMLATRFGIHHATLEMEPAGTACATPNLIGS
ncbi:cobalt-zinc-cadmium efflux system protein [Roseovarius halotolerans]|uniref:Cadmium, cobalt and zinc/H(+)-K(+) antiporter n=1 Tax=Roseovarius halotolerans TaxID=505353 RepID=A0A1X6ZV15_9RHOB|nr:cation diffusion facilitator family transporter [Roseovarius halotolerans]RKT27769.1 cobalt-zinc-cadmium efflux system protein [Roseovarius halotolerans]SLN61879.1 Cadmium, cobalt and zinc/H(+)-K(+) antiporter [Roseovarius halotolerans]